MNKIQKKPVVVPSIAIEGHKNPIIEVIEKERLPMTAVGVVKLPGSIDWVSFTVNLEGLEVTKLEVEEPNLKQIAEESAKIAFVGSFMRDEF